MQSGFSFFIKYLFDPAFPTSLSVLIIEAKIQNTEVIVMKEPVSARMLPNIVDYSPDELMRLRRERIRDRRLRKGSLISGRILSLTESDNLIELYPAELDAAI